MKVAVIGCGRWGSFIAWYLDRGGHAVTLYGREGSERMKRFMSARRNEYLELPESVGLTTSLVEATGAGTIVISINSQGLAGLVEELAALNVRGKTIVLCMKGLEVGTGRRLSQIVEDGLYDDNRVAVWLGPGHVQEFCAGVPNCMVIDSENEEVKRRLVSEFSSSLLRFYYGSDMIGNEVGAATKNVIGIAAGMLDGLGLTTVKGALMSRGTREVARLIAAMGGNELCAYGLCHLGDYEATVFSRHSHNRLFGEMYVQGKKMEKLAEGYYTVLAMMQLAGKYGVELPITAAVYRILYEGAGANVEFDALFSRQLKDEFC